MVPSISLALLSNVIGMLISVETRLYLSHHSVIDRLSILKHVPTSCQESIKKANETLAQQMQIVVYHPENGILSKVDIDQGFCKRETRV